MWLYSIAWNSHKAQEPAVVARQAEEYGAYLGRNLEIKLGQLEVEDQHRKDAIVFAKYNSDKQQYRPAKVGLLYNPEDQDLGVIRGDKKGKEDK